MSLERLASGVRRVNGAQHKRLGRQGRRQRQERAKVRRHAVWTEFVRLHAPYADSSVDPDGLIRLDVSFIRVPYADMIPDGMTVRAAVANGEPIGWQ